MSHLMNGRQMAPNAQIAGRPMGPGHVRYAWGAVARLLELDRTAVWAAMLGATIVVLIALPLSAALNIWLDEAFTLHSTSAGPLVAWAQALTFDGQPPVYSSWNRCGASSRAAGQVSPESCAPCNATRPTAKPVFD
jgi:hypothetical protein